jgi:chromate reductase
MRSLRQDEEANPPLAWTQFSDKIKAVDAVLFVTPEYNRSVPAGLKNALDVGSRPLVKNVWNEKPSAVISASPGAIGGFGTNHHLRQSLVALNAPTMVAPALTASIAIATPPWSNIGDFIAPRPGWTSSQIA